MKTGPVIRVTGLVVLACLSIAAIYYIETTTSDGLSPTTKPTPSAQSTNDKGDIPSLSLGTVAIQTFSGSMLVRSGNGAVISSDGLIVTLAYVAPYGSGSYAYQVATSTGALLRAQAVRRSNGLVLLKVASSDLNAVSFDKGSLAAGAQVRAVGALASLSRYTPLILPVDIAYVDQADEVALSLDKTYMSLMAGARVVDANGRSVGLVQPGSYARLLPASAINAIVEEYLAQKK